MAYDPGRRQVVMFGGKVPVYMFPDQWFGDTWVWEGGSWRRMFPLHSPPPRMGHAMAYDPVRKAVLLFGGATHGYATLGDCWSWDGRDWSRVSATAPWPLDRAQHRMATDPLRGRIVMFGGYSQPLGWFGKFRFLQDTWEWDGTRWQQMQPSNSPQARQLFGFAFCTKTKRVTLYGGNDGSVVAWTDTWEWDGRDWRSIATSVHPGIRTSTAMAPHPTGGSVVLHGGYVFTGSLDNETWEWDGASWRKLLIQGAIPLVRGSPAMATDTSRGLAVLSGGDAGSGNPPRRDTWAFDGVAWAKVDEPQMPRGWPVAAYDDLRDVLLLAVQGPTWPEFWAWSDAGYARVPSKTTPRVCGCNYLLNLAWHRGSAQAILVGESINQGFDTWAWDGNDWQQVASATPFDGWGPVTYDPLQDRILLVSYLNTVWAWDPRGWTKLPSANPPPRRGGKSITFDAGRNRLVLFGGGTTSTSFSDTWEWDGAAWSQRLPARSPASISNASFVYHPLLGKSVLFGGAYDPSFTPTRESFAWDGKDWEQLDVPLLPTRPNVYGGQPMRCGVYDVGRNRILGVAGFGHLAVVTNQLWELVPTSLETSQPHPRAGDTISWSASLPDRAGDLLVLGLSDATWPGVPLRDIPGYGVERLPLRAGPILTASLQTGLIRTLDSRGRAEFTLRVPNDPNLVGWRLHAAGFTVGTGLRIGGATVPTVLEVVR